MTKEKKKEAVSLEVQRTIEKNGEALSPASIIPGNVENGKVVKV